MMGKYKLNIPVGDVRVISSLNKRELNSPLHSGDGWQSNEEEFGLTVPGVGYFYACHGKEVEYVPDPGADPDWVKLYLNGQVLVALLHQRKIINFHASSFVCKGLGIMIPGETGAGKSSLTLSYILGGADFLTDDLTPVIFREGRPFILPLNRKMKLREETAEEMKIEKKLLTGAEAGTGKKYLEIKPAGMEDHSLDIVLKISIGNVTKPQFSEPEPAGKFSLLRSEICSWEMLAGMPDTEAAYLQQLVRIVELVRVVEVQRPSDITISDFRSAVDDFLMKVV